MVDLVILTIYKGRCWCVAELSIFEEDKLTETVSINKFYEVDEGSIRIYDTIGGSGYGYSKGNLLRKVSLSGKDFKTVTI